MSTNMQIRKGDDYTIEIDLDEDITEWVINLYITDSEEGDILEKEVTVHDDAAEGQTSIDISNEESIDIDGTYEYTIIATRADSTLKCISAGVVTFADNILSSDLGDGITVSGGASGSAIQNWTSDTFTYESEQTNPSMVFTETFITGTLSAYKNGVLQKKDTDYTEKVDLSGIDWIGTIYTDDNVEVRYAY